MSGQGLLFSFLFLLTGSSAASSGSIHVSSYGAYPDDGIDDVAAIKSAITYAKANDIAVINFSDGAYDLITPPSSYHVLLVNCHDLTLQGAVDAEGDPSTRLLRHLSLANELSPPFLMYGRDCSNLKVENFILDNTPQNCTAGEVVSASSGTVVVDVFEDLPFFDGMACYAANAWDPQTKDLLEVPSLTFNVSPADWSTVSGGDGRRVQISDVEFDQYLTAGDAISWNFGVDGAAQLFFLSCDGLTLENLKISNALNIANLFGDIHNLTLKKIDISPEGNQLAVGPRDGFHISRCTGDLLADDISITGVRWDGLVVKGMFGTVELVLSSTSIVFSAYSEQDLGVGDDITFLDESGTADCAIQSWVHTSDSNGHHYIVLFDEAIPSFTTAGTYLNPLCWRHDSITITNMSAESVAGAAIIIMDQYAVITDCSFDHVMYAPVELGSTPAQASPCLDVTVQDSVFSRSGWSAKPYGKTGMVAIGTGRDGFTGNLNREVVIQGNLFMDTVAFDGIGIHATDASQVLIADNEFVNVSDALQVETATVEKVTLAANTVVSDNDDNDLSYIELAGDWRDSSLLGYGGSSTRFAPSGSQVQWIPDLPVSGRYDISIYKVVHSTSDQNAKITVHHDGGDFVQYLDYTSGTSGWVSLGTFSFTSGTNGCVQNEHQGPGTYCRADAVKFELAAPSDVLIDNGDVGYAEVSGTWLTSSLLGYLNSQSRYSYTAGASVQWSPELSAAGDYEVYIYKVAYVNSDPNAKITVRHAGGESVQTIDFSDGTSGWIALGTYSFNAGTSGWVKNERQSMNVRADAVWFVKKP